MALLQERGEPGGVTCAQDSSRLPLLHFSRSPRKYEEGEESFCVLSLSSTVIPLPVFQCPGKERTGCEPPWWYYLLLKESGGKVWLSRSTMDHLK